VIVANNDKYHQILFEISYLVKLKIFILISC